MIRRLFLSGVLVGSLGCGCAGAAFEGFSTDTDPASEGRTVPSYVQAQLADCAEEAASRLPSTGNTIAFNVRVTEEGRIGPVEIKHSSIDDKNIKSCIASVLRTMSLPASVTALRSSQRASDGRVSPQSRALVGNPLVLGGVVIIELLPIVIVAAGVTIVVGIAIELVSEMSKPEWISEEEYERCQKVFEACKVACGKMGARWKGYGSVELCMKECRDAEGCWGVTYP